jgi:hypothetical protein
VWQNKTPAMCMTGACRRRGTNVRGLYNAVGMGAKKTAVTSQNRNASFRVDVAIQISDSHYITRGRFSHPHICPCKIIPQLSGNRQTKAPSEGRHLGLMQHNSYRVISLTHGVTQLYRHSFTKQNQHWDFVRVFVRFQLRNKRITQLC